MRLVPLPAMLAAAAIVLLLLVLADDGTGGTETQNAPSVGERQGGPTDRASVRATICEVFGQRCGPALQVAMCETGGTLNPYARGRAGERGIFQLHPVHFSWLDESKLWLPGYNAMAAYRLSRGGRDWSAWTCRP